MKRLTLVLTALLFLAILCACSDAPSQQDETGKETGTGQSLTQEETAANTTEETVTSSETTTTTTAPATTTAPVTTTTAPPTTTAPVTTTRPQTGGDPVPVTMQDALFIGDSRTDGMRLYSKMSGVDYFCATSMTVYGVQTATPSVAGYGTISLSSLLQKRSYDKIYILLGINEIGNNLDSIAAKYSELVTLVRTLQPDAAIFIQANFNVTAQRSSKGDSINNTRINGLNERLKAFANGSDIFYLDANHLFGDGYGNLLPTYTWDGVHFQAFAYPIWAQWVNEQTLSLLGESVS